MTELAHRADCSFSATELRAALRVMLPLCVAPTDIQAGVAAVVNEVAQVLRAEAACVFESRGASAGTMTEMYRKDWRDWHTEALSACLNGRALREITQDSIQMTWRAPAGLKAPRSWHAVASCIPTGLNYYLTLAIARRAQTFSAKESQLLRILHQSGLFELVSQRRASRKGNLSPRMRNVLSGLLHGRSEKQISIDLNLSRHTVHSYVKGLYRRYSVKAREELLSLCIDPAARQAMAR